MSYRQRRFDRLRARTFFYVALGPTGREGFPFKHKRFAELEARMRSVRWSQNWTIMRYGERD